jgi:hypothetical protein
MGWRGWWLMNAPMTRRQFFGRMFAAAVVAVLLHSTISRYVSQSRSLQWMLDWGVPIPSGTYTITRPLYVRRDYTRIMDCRFNVQGCEGFIISAHHVAMVGCIIDGASPCAVRMVASSSDVWLSSLAVFA